MNRSRIDDTKQGRRLNRQEKIQRREAERRREARSRRIFIGVLTGVVVLVLGFSLIYFAKQSSSSSSASSNSPYAALNGVSCDSTEQLNYHIHAHISIYINGNAVQIPGNIGIANDGSCFYWLHTHDTSGIIHIESPTKKIYTLGQFSQLWGQRFSELQYPIELDQNTDWQVYVNGKAYKGDFHSIPLEAHTLVTLAYNSPGITPDTTYAWQGL